jgi:hypothetical protein
MGQRRFWEHDAAERASAPCSRGVRDHAVTSVSAARQGGPAVVEPNSYRLRSIVAEDECDAHNAAPPLDRCDTYFNAWIGDAASGRECRYLPGPLARGLLE